MKPIDLRSDTLTLPTPAMREAIYRAELGDDQYGEDPTVIRLEEMSAEMLGKEAGLLVNSGTQGNLIGILALCARGDEVIVGDGSHVCGSEAGGVSVLGGVVLRTAPNLPDGTMRPEAIRGLIAADNPHSAHTQCVVIENTHNKCNGAVLDRAQMDAMLAPAKAAGLSAHLDGARIFNAAVALGVPVATLVEPFDSATFCLSKGLCCPVGSMLVGSKELIYRARRLRQLLGGALRQAGIIAAAGVYALQHMVDRLAEDHANAYRLAIGLADTGMFDIDPRNARSNILVFGFRDKRPDTLPFVNQCAARGVFFRPFGPGLMRMVTHHDVSAEDITRALDIVRQELKAG